MNVHVHIHLYSHSNILSLMLNCFEENKLLVVFEPTLFISGNINGYHDIINLVDIIRSSYDEYHAWCRPNYTTYSIILIAATLLATTCMYKILWKVVKLFITDISAFWLNIHCSIFPRVKLTISLTGDKPSSDWRWPNLRKLLSEWMS